MKIDSIICYYDEIALKGRNRRTYEDMLIKNIRIMLKPYNSISNVMRMFGRIVVVLRKDSFETEADNVYATLKNVFGIAYFTPAFTTSLELDDIKQACLHVVKSSTGDSFKIQAKRSNKQFPLNSLEIGKEVGAHVYGALEKEVKMIDPAIICVVYILEKRAHVSGERFEGARGLPVGTAGPMLAMLSGGIDSPVAAYYMQKRGASLTFIHFHNYPYTSQASIDKVVDLVHTLTCYQPKITLHLIAFSDIQNAIALSCPKKLRIILYRRFMYRIAEEIARRDGHKALVTGEALSQVASQTIENITVTDNAVSLPVMRPLIGFDKCEIIKKAHDIGTFNISIRPHEDCCARFVPDHPETSATVDSVHKAEEALDVSALVDTALENMETKEVLYSNNESI